MIIGIACVASDFAIGKVDQKTGFGQLLFNLPADMKFFRETTKGHICVFGKTTYDSLPKRPLKNRVNIVLWDKATSIDCLDGAITFNNFNTLLNFINIVSKIYNIYICGGASLYKLFLPYYDELLITKVSKTILDANVFFPNLDENKLYYIDRVINTGQDNNLNYEIIVYKRRQL